MTTATMPTRREYERVTFSTSTPNVSRREYEEGPFPGSQRAHFPQQAKPITDLSAHLNQLLNIKPRPKLPEPGRFGIFYHFATPQESMIWKNPRAEFLKGFGKGFATQTQIPALAGKKLAPLANTAEKIGSAAGRLTESLAELVSTGYALRGAGLVAKAPKAGATFGKALQTGFIFGTQQTTEEIRKGVAEAIYDEDFGFRGGSAVRESFIFGAVLSLAGSGIKGVWNKLRPSEQAQALKTLGLKKGASLNEINQAARIQARKFHPDKVKGMRESFDKVINARDVLRKANAKDIIIGNAKQNFKTNLVQQMKVSPDVADNAIKMLDAGEPITKVDQMISQAKFGIKPLATAEPKAIPEKAVAKPAAKAEQRLKEKAKPPAKPGAEAKQPLSELVAEVKEAWNEFVETRPLIGREHKQRREAAEKRIKEARAKLSSELPSKGTEPWQMTKRQFEAQAISDRSVLANIEAMRGTLAEDTGIEHLPHIPEVEATTHRREVEKAVQKGKPVPRYVLEEYKSEPWAQEALKKAEPAVKHTKKQPATEAPPKMKGRPGFVDLTPIADAGKQVKTTGEKAAKLVTRFGGLEPEVRKVLIEYEEQLRELPKVVARESIDKFGKLTPRQEVIIGNHIEKPKENPLPKELEPYVKLFREGQDKTKAILEELGYPADWPNQYRKRLQERLHKLEGRAEPDIEAIRNVEEAIKDAEGLEYFHHHYKPQPKAKRILSYFRRRISKRPKGLLGRKIPTLEKAESLGLERAPLAVTYAHMMHSAERAQEASNLIKAINENPNLSQWAEDAPEGWVYLDQSIFPDSVQKNAWVEKDKIKQRIKRRKYPVPIAEALHELTYARTPHALTRMYDKFNFAMKMIGFYNPLVMTKNDLVQGWRASGMKYATRLPGALETFIKKDEKYQRLRKDGLFNNVVSWTPSAEQLTDEMLKRMRRTWGQNVAADAGKYLNPLNIVKTIRKANDVTTWNIDEIMRIAAYDAIKNTPMTKGMTDFEVVELANDFMVNYAKLPKATKEHLSRAFFVPTYRIGNFRVWFGKILKEPWRYKGPLLRTTGYKMFISFGLPALTGAAIGWMTKKRRENVRTEKGYRLVIPNPKTGKDTVYSLSDPLLEGAKITQRVVPHTLSLNLAAMPSLILRLMSGPKFRNQRDPYGEFFKLGTPIYRDIVNWTDPDKTVPQKILTQLAIAYTYQRKLRPAENDKKISAEALAKALSIWTDWKEHEKELRKTLGLGINLREKTVPELLRMKKDNTYKTPPKGKLGAKRKHPRYKNPELVERIEKEIKKRKKIDGR